MTWRRMRLKHACVDAGQYGLNVSADDYSTSGMRLIRTSDITESGVLKPADEAVYVDLEIEDRHRLQAGDLLLSRSGTLGRSFLIPDLPDLATFAGYLVRFRPSPRVHPRYLAYVAGSAEFQSAIQADAVSSTIQNFNAERYANIEFSLPSFEEQRRIADFLDAEMTKMVAIESRRRQEMKLLDLRLSALMTDCYEEMGEKNGFVRLRHIITGMEQGWSPACESRPAEPGEWGVVKAGCINGGVFRADETKALPMNLEPKYVYLLRPGDLLMSRASGSLDLIGSIGIFPGHDSKLMLSDKIYRLYVDHRGIAAEYVAIMLRSARVRGELKLGVSGAGGLANNLPSGVVKGLRVPRAALSCQLGLIKEINSQQALIEASKSALQRQADLLRERQAAVITAAVTGQIDVTTAGGVGVA